MTAEDKKALSWDGDDDVATPAPRPETPAKGAISGSAKADNPLTKQAPSSALLIIYGILAGAYLIYTIGWIISVFNDNRGPFDDFLTEVMYQVGEYLAIASPALWFATALLLTRGRRPIIRILALILGLLVVIPWSFVLLGA
jgi:hypothetical protein